MCSQIIRTDVAGSMTSAIAMKPLSEPVLGIVAGSGRLPAQLIEACQKSGRPFFVLAFGHNPLLPLSDDIPHVTVRLGAIGEALEHLRRANVSELVLAGRVERPSILNLRPDATATKLYARLGSAMFAGDNTLLKAVVGFLEDEGFKVIGSEDILNDLLTPPGVLGRVVPDERAMADIAHGVKVAKAIGSLDIGQAVVVENGYVLGVEAAEGTDELIARIAPLKQSRGCGVLVKAKKPNQETRVDLPAIGVETIENIHAVGLAGIAVEAGGSLIIEKHKLIQKADELGMFVIGISP